MALSTIIYKKEPAEIGELVLDVAISESHQYRSEVTQFPIEAGGDIADHIINKPVELTVVGFITNSPVKIFGGVLENLASDRVAIPNRVQSAFTLLSDMRDLKKTFTVVTGLKVYLGMFFKSLSFPRDRATGDTLRFTAVLTKITTAASRTVVRQNLDPGTTEAKENTKDLGAEKVDRGGKPVEAVNAATEEGAKLQSWAYQIIF